MMAGEFHPPIDAIEKFISNHATMKPAEAERHLMPIMRDLLRPQGYELSQTESRDRAPDYIADPAAGSNQVGRLGIAYKQLRRPISISEVDGLVGLAQRTSIARIMIVSSSGFTRAARETSKRDYPIDIALYAVEDLRALGASLAPREGSSPEFSILRLIQDFSERAAHIVAEYPSALDDLEWRDLERMMAAVLEGIGFEAQLTPASKDGGKDIVLTLWTDNGGRQTFAIELKHWRSRQHVGARAVKDFVEVVATEGHQSGLFLSSYGYTPTAFGSLTEVERSQVRAGDKTKIVSLCRTYVRAERGLWTPTTQNALPEMLFCDTF